jgi:hypothetical protein
MEQRVKMLEKLDKGWVRLGELEALWAVEVRSACVDCLNRASADEKIIENLDNVTVDVTVFKSKVTAKVETYIWFAKDCWFVFTTDIAHAEFDEMEDHATEIGKAMAQVAYYGILGASTVDNLKNPWNTETEVHQLHLGVKGVLC